MGEASIKQPIKKTLAGKITWVVIVLILLYLLVVYIKHINRETIGIYEVHTGSLYQSNDIQAVIIREELLVYADKQGYIHYYRHEGERVSKSAALYSTDSTNSIYQRLAQTEAGTRLSENDKNDMKELIRDYHMNQTSFSDGDLFREQFLGDYYQKLDELLSEQMTQIINDTGVVTDFSVFSASTSGLVSYYCDNLYPLTENMITEALFRKKSEITSLKTTEAVTLGTPVMKLVYQDNWSLVALLDKEQYTMASKRTKQTITFSIDRSQTQITAPFSTYEKDGQYYMKITMNRYLNEYIRMRFVTLHIVPEEVAEGLKIPVTALTQKQFYKIPSAYFIRGGNTTAEGLLVLTYDQSTGEPVRTFTATDIKYRSDEYYWIDTAILSSDKSVISGDGKYTSPLYQFIVTLEGVYCINSGKTEFRKVERLATGSSYCIVKNTAYQNGLFAFDRIVIDAGKVQEDMLIY